MRWIFAVIPGLLLGCFSMSHIEKQTEKNLDRFPDAWWKPIPPEELKSWEIPPQAARRDLQQVILSKRTELGVFSNLAETPFELDGTSYKSVEAFWQSLKYPEDAADPRLNSSVRWQYTRSQVQNLSGFEAKAAGDLANENMKILGISWQSYQGKKFEPKTTDVDFHSRLIEKAITEKIMQNPPLQKLLKQTEQLVLLPDHKQSGTITPAYKYYDILMKIRAGL